MNQPADALTAPIPAKGQSVGKLTPRGERNHTSAFQPVTVSAAYKSGYGGWTRANRDNRNPETLSEARAAS